MKIHRKCDCKILAYILFCLAICTVSGLSADASTNNSDTSQEVYFYIPVSFWPNAGEIERCLSKPMYQHAAVQLLHSPSGYHVSMGSFLMPSKGSANDVAFKVQKVIRNTFSQFTARIDKKREGVTVFGRFVVIVLKTDKNGNNKHHTLFHAIHKKITKLILAAGGSRVGFLEFRPHCSIASVVDVSAPDFQQIRNRLLKNLTRPVSEVRLVVNPRVLQYRISPQIA